MSGPALPGGCTAIIPSGGRAERLGGVVKPLLAGPDGTSPLARTLESLAGLGIAPSVVVATTPKVAEVVAGLPGPVTLVAEDPPFAGPAAALAAGMRRAAGAWVLVVPADVPAVEPGARALMGAALAAGQRTELFLGTVAGRDQQLFALVRSAALAAAVRSRENWANASVRALFAGLRTVRVELPADQALDVDTWADAARQGFDNAEAPTWRGAMDIARAVGGAVAGDSGGADPAEAACDSVPLATAVGRVTARAVTAERPIPHYASSAMDGFVIGRPPEPGPAGGRAWRLEPCPAAPGATAHLASGLGVLAPGTARPVLTGGALPAGAHGVIRQEYARVAGGLVTLLPDAPAAELDPGRHIRAAGREAAAGATLVAAGQRLTPAHAAYLALAGIDEVAVLPRPAVGLVFTGDEVVTAGLPDPGQVRDTFGPVLPWVLESWGAEVVAATRVPDDPGALREAVDAQLARGARLVLTTGGTGHSSADHVRTLLETRFAQNGTGAVAIPSVRMRPGHPTMLGLLSAGGPGGAPLAALVALPGNPLAAMTALRVVARPVFEGLCGTPADEPWAGALATPAGPGRADLVVPARRLPDGAWEPSGPGGSAMLSGLAAADGLAVVPSEGTGETGAVHVLSLPWPT